MQWIAGTFNTVERLSSRAKLTPDDQRKRVLPKKRVSNMKSSYLLTNVYGIFKMLITFLLKLDKYLFFPMNIPLFM